MNGLNKEIQGVIVSWLSSRSPLMNSGILPGDILLEWNGSPVSYYGEIQFKKDNSRLINIDDQLAWLTKDQNLEISYWSIQNKSIKKSIIGLNKINQLPIRKYYSFLEAEKLDMLIFSGMILMNLTQNYIYQSLQNKQIGFNQYILADLLKYSLSENQDKSKVVITNLLPGRQVRQDQVLFDGCIIDSINDFSVETIKDIAKALYKVINDDNNKDNYIKIISNNNIWVTTIKPEECILNGMQLMNYINSKKALGELF